MGVSLFIAHSFFTLSAIYDKNDTLETTLSNALNNFLFFFGMIYYTYMLKKMNRETIQSLIAVAEQKMQL